MIGHTDPYDSPSHQAVKAFLMTRGHLYSLDAFKSRGRYRYCVRSESGLDEVMVEILVKPYPEDSGKFTLFAHAPQPVASHHRGELLLMFADSNFGDEPLKTELNPSTGVVRCGFSSYLMADTVSSDHLAKMEHRAVGMISTLLPILENYADEGRSP